MRYYLIKLGIKVCLGSDLNQYRDVASDSPHYCIVLQQIATNRSYWWLKSGWSHWSRSQLIASVPSRPTSRILGINHATQNLLTWCTVLSIGSSSFLCLLSGPFEGWKTFGFSKTMCSSNICGIWYFGHNYKCLKVLYSLGGTNRCKHCSLQSEKLLPISFMNS